MLSRRDFLKLSGAGMLSLYVASRGKFILHALAQIPGGTLDPGDVTKYVTPLLIPPVMPKAGVVKQKGKTVDYYEISMRQFQEQILPAGMPFTTVWGYGAVKSASPNGLLLHNAPSLTIEAQANVPVRVKWINELVDGNGNFLPHLLPVDPTLHWANPPGGVRGRDSRPTFAATPSPYTGPVPIITHVHGAVGVGDESDGYAEAWYLPKAKNIPAGYAKRGTWYDYFAGKAAARYGAAWGPGFATFQYPNHNRASTIWYHDHALGMTRLNVYAGPAGFYIVRGGPAGDKAVLDSRFGTVAVLPGPAPREGDKFPSNKSYFEIPIAIQDRAFNDDGSLFYPDSRVFFDGLVRDYIPDGDFSPIWNPEFFGNTIMVNGNTWPFQTVQQRRYRLRFLNGCQSRFLILDFRDLPGVEVWQIGNEGGFLAAPVNLTADHGNRRLMALIEEAGEGADEEGEEVEGPVEALLGTVAAGVWTERKWMDPVTENPAVGATEVWEIYNTTADAHPMHIHEIAFEVVNREGLVLNDEGEVDEPIRLDGEITAPEPWESGFKDTVIAYPGQVTRLKAHFTSPGQFVWHCHIVEHEDNEMMRPYRIGPPQPGQPD